MGDAHDHKLVGVKRPVAHKKYLLEAALTWMAFRGGLKAVAAKRDIKRNLHTKLLIC